MAPASRLRVLGGSKRLVRFFEVDGPCLGRAVLQHDGDDAGPDGDGGTAAAPFVHLAGCDAGEYARALTSVGQDAAPRSRSRIPSLTLAR